MVPLTIRMATDNDFDSDTFSVRALLRHLRPAVQRAISLVPAEGSLMVVLSWR